MNKLIFTGSLACIVFLLTFGVLFPANSVMWLASTSVAYTIFRVLMAALLLAVLFTTPPRHIAVRLLMGAAAVVLVGLGINLAASDSMHLLDIVLFIQLGLGFGLEALELNEEEIEDRIAALERPQKALTAGATQG